jgi:alkylhydroperoxidase/carboxymuconolactone decarboxylase family protein YurZ
LNAKNLKAHLRRVDAGTADAFKHLRDAVIAAGPLDFKTAELIMLGSFATAGYEPAVKAHAKRLHHELGVTREAIEHAVLVTFGATSTLVRVTEALIWIDQALAERRSEEAA